MQSIYIGKMISLKEKTKEDIEKEFEIIKIKNKSWQSKTLDDYINFIKNWCNYDYIMSTEDNCYGLDYNEIENLIINNYADVNDGGIYNYATIIEIPINKMYAYTEVISIQIFKYNKESNKYEKQNEHSKEMEYIIKKLF